MLKSGIFKAGAILLVSYMISSCKYQSKLTQDKWTFLFNGKNLEGWDSYIGPRYDSVKGNFAGERIGLNNDADSVFKIVEEDGENVIRISGQHFGGLISKAEFENYHLQLQFKWGEQKYMPRKKSKRDSGLLYHSHGPHGVGWFFWMAAQEFQIQEGDCGDYWSILSDVDVNVIMNSDSTYTYNKDGILKFFGPHGRLRGYIKKSGNAEKPNGEWNTLDLYAYGGASIHKVNGKTVMVVKNSYQKENDKIVPLTKGKIQLQSEGAEIFFKNVRIEKISGLVNAENL